MLLVADSVTKVTGTEDYSAQNFRVEVSWSSGTEECPPRRGPPPDRWSATEPRAVRNPRLDPGGIEDCLVYLEYPDPRRRRTIGVRRADPWRTKLKTNPPAAGTATWRKYAGAPFHARVRQHRQRRTHHL